MIRPKHPLVAVLASLLACTPQPAAYRAAPAAPVADGSPYRVQVGDILTLRLYTAPELNEDIAVRPDGRISTTLVQSLSAAGRTPDEIAADLRQVYAHELKDPALTVEVKSPSPSRIYVAGEVVSPGELDTQGPNLTLMQAVARAGGLRTDGDPDHVLILRHGPADTPIVLAADYRGASTGTVPQADIRLAPFDVVYVPRTGIGQAYIWFNQHFQQFVPVNWGFSYNVNPVVNNKP